MSRPPIKHSPNKWDITMFTPDNQVENYGERVEVLKEYVESMVVDKKAKPEEKMILFETLERLGVAYHFEQEIERQIAHLFLFFAGKNYGDYDLFTTALHFRMFRQYGHDAPCSVFNKFKNDDGTFKKSLTNDIKGLLSLHEASYLKFRSEAILNEANAFATNHLKNAMPLLDPSGLQERVARALSRPMHWSIPRLEARHYISFYEKQESRNELLLAFAKLDFNFMQNLHKKEISEVIRWRDSLGTAKFPYIRDAPMTCYLWPAAFNLDSRDSFPRICAGKVLCLYLMMNDSFDSYATWEEGKKFIEILQQPRWDYEQIGQLPEGIQVVYKAICNTFEEFDRDIARQGRPYAAPYAREALRKMASAYVNQLSLYLGHWMPTFLKIISLGMYDSGAFSCLAAYLMGKESATEEDFKWLMTEPTLAEASGLFVRYTNEIATNEREREENKNLNTAIDCYMKEHLVSREEAVAKIRELAEGTWMTMNRECVTTTGVPREYLKGLVNYARAAYISYWEGSDEFTYTQVTGMDNDIETLFINPIKMG